MSHQADDNEWKLKLRDGQLQTPFKHYTLIAKGVAGVLKPGYSCRPGSAFMAMKFWASSPDEAAHMLRMVGEKIGFQITGDTQVYNTEPQKPPMEKPFGYGINFTPFDP